MTIKLESSINYLEDYDNHHMQVLCVAGSEKEFENFCNEMIELGKTKDLEIIEKTEYIYHDDFRYVIDFEYDDYIIYGTGLQRTDIDYFYKKIVVLNRKWTEKFYSLGDTSNLIKLHLELYK